MDLIRFEKLRISLEIGAITLVLGSAIFQPYRLVIVKGDSMSPTYMNHTAHLAMRVDGPLHRGQVVVLDSPEGTLIKRIKFLAGDKFLQMKIGGVWRDVVNVVASRKKNPRMETRIFTIPPGYAYVLGDHPIGSIDSLEFGPISTKEIWGTIVDQRAKMPDPNEALFRSYRQRTLEMQAKGRKLTSVVAVR